MKFRKIGILGLPGSGKTTFAQYLYTNELPEKVESTLNKQDIDVKEKNPKLNEIGIEYIIDSCTNQNGEDYSKEKAIIEDCDVILYLFNASEFSGSSERIKKELKEYADCFKKYPNEGKKIVFIGTYVDKSNGFKIDEFESFLLKILEPMPGWFYLKALNSLKTKEGAAKLEEKILDFLKCEQSKTKHRNSVENAHSSEKGVPASKCPDEQIREPVNESIIKNKFFMLLLLLFFATLPALGQTFRTFEKNGVEVRHCLGCKNQMQNEKMGIINPQTGEWIIQPKYDWVSTFWYDGFAQVKLNGKYSFIDTTGKELIPFKYDRVYNFGDDGRGYAKVWLNDKYGLINTSGKEIVSPKYDEIWGFNKEGVSIVKNKFYGLINKSGREILPCRYDQIDAFSDGMAAVKQNSRWGFVNTSGQVVISPKYAEVRMFDRGYAEVMLPGYGQTWHFIDKTGKTRR